MATLCVRLPDEQSEAMTRISKEFGCTESQLARNAVAAFLDRFENAGEVDRMRMVLPYRQRAEVAS